MFIRKVKYDELVEALKYATTQLEYINTRITYFDASGISKSVTEAAIAKAQNASERVKCK